MIMTVLLQAVPESDLPFKPDATEPTGFVAVQSEPDDDALADGETDPFDWFNLRDVYTGFVRLIGAHEAVLRASEATLVLSYPLDVPATRLIRPADGKEFTRGELVKLIDETYRQAYLEESETQSSPTPPIAERGQILNRPASDGTFGIWGHDLEDLGIEGISVYLIDGRVWMHPRMCS